MSSNKSTLTSRPVLPGIRTVKKKRSRPMACGAGCFAHVSQITETLFLSAAAAVTPAAIHQHGITCIVNATLEVPHLSMPYIETVKISIEDSPFAQLASYFDPCADKIREVEARGGKTLVHCVAGVSRSSSLCIAYLMKYHQMSLKQAYMYVKDKRSIIRPNTGFFRQLIDYERRLFGTNSVSFVNSPIGLIPDVYEPETRGMVYLPQDGAYSGANFKPHNHDHDHNLKGPWR